MEELGILLGTVEGKGTWQKGDMGKGMAQQNDMGKGMVRQGQPMDWRPRGCFNCGSLDHVARACPKVRQTNEVEVEEDEVRFVGAT